MVAGVGADRRSHQRLASGRRRGDSLGASLRCDPSHASQLLFVVEDHHHLFARVGDDVALAQLFAAAGFDFAVYQDLAALDGLLGLAAGGYEVLDLEELVEVDRGLVGVRHRGASVVGW